MLLVSMLGMNSYLSEKEVVRLVKRLFLDPWFGLGVTSSVGAACSTDVPDVQPVMIKRNVRTNPIHAVALAL